MTILKHYDHRSLTNINQALTNILAHAFE